MSISVSILLCLLVAIAAPGLHRLAPGAARVLLPLAPLGLTVHLCTFLPAVVRGESILVAHRWAPEVGLALSWRVDGLGLLFGLLISGVGTVVTLFAGSYLAGHDHLGRLYGFLFLFMASMLGVVLADNALALFVFWELTSLSSYFLIGFDHTRGAARAAALQALLVTGIGGLALLGGVVLLAGATGTYELSEMSARVPGDLRGHGHYVAIVVLVLAAALTKSAQFPFHFWLPRAMEAPTPVSAYLHAATMVKAGVYLLARLAPVLSGSALWHESLTWVGAITALLGGALALGERHFKRVLAYSTVGALGTMVLLVGIGTPAAIQAMVVLLVAHALYKGALFLVAGAVDHAVHEPDVERLGRLGAALPLTATAAGLAALSMGGVPPLIGFVSKELMYTATLGAGAARALTGCAFVVGALFLAVAWNVGVRPFWGRVAEVAAPTREVPWPLWSAPLLLALLGLTFGIWPGSVDALLRAAVLVAAPGARPAPLGLWHGAGWPLGLGALTLVAGFTIHAGRFALRRLARPLAGLARFGPDSGYRVALSTLVWVAAAQTRLLQRGHLRGYLGIILATTLALVGYTLVGRHGLPPHVSGEGFRFHEAVIAGLILVATLATARARSRFAAILSLGVVGYGVALVFLLFGAPDLGITQLVVETLTVILLVVAFHHLPRFREHSAATARLRDASLSVGIGALMTVFVLVASEARGPQPVSTFYGEASVPAAHGRNVVNVILTDFRALDTLGEITVLATAALGVFAILKLRSTAGAR